MTKHGEMSKVKCNWLFHLYVCSILVDKTKQNTNDLPTTSTVLTWWPGDILTTCIRRAVELAARPITPPLIICYKDINFSPGLKENDIYHVYVWNEALLKILKVGIVSLIKYFGTKKDYCCQRYKRPQNCLINTKSFSEKVEVEIFVSHILFFQTLIDLLFLKWITWVDIHVHERRYIFVFYFNLKLHKGEMGSLKFNRQFLK